MPESLTVLVRRVIRAPALRLFQAWTQPEQLSAWWGPGPVSCPEAQVDLREGGQYALANQMPDGSITWIRGSFLTIESPHKLVYTWGIGDAAPNEVVTVRFEPRAIGTEVIISHERIGSEQARANHEAGWIGCLDGLEAFVGE